MSLPYSSSARCFTGFSRMRRVLVTLKGVSEAVAPDWVTIHFANQRREEMDGMEYCFVFSSPSQYMIE